MPLSAIISKNKRKTQSALHCDKLDACLAESAELTTRFSEIKDNLGYDPDLIKKANEQNLVSEENLKEAMEDTENWKSLIKSDIKGAVMIEKRRQKEIRKARRKALGQPEPSGAKTGMKRRRGSFL